MSLSPRESAAFIYENADHVKLNLDAITPLAQKFYADLKSGVFGSSWEAHAMHPKAVGACTVNWIFLVDSLNFSFWTDDEHQYTVTFRGKSYTGYMALCATINRAIEEGVNILDPNCLISLSLESAKKIFRSDSSVEIPLIRERLDIMHDHAKTLLSCFSGCFTNCIAQCDASATKLLDLIVRKFPSFDDRALYKDKSVCFFKRAQILIADLWVAFKGQSYGRFDDIDTLTAFADYRVPQVLAYFDVLKYDSILLEKLNNGEFLQNGSALEVEIRGVCLHAVEILVRRVHTLVAQSGDYDQNLPNSVVADKFLWLYRRAHSEQVERTSVMHRTRCIYY